MKTSNKEDSHFYTDKESFISKIKEGTLFLVNLNATNSDLWCHDNFLDYKDIEILDMGEVPFINTSFGSMHNFDNPERYGMIDAMIVKEKGGSVASLASAGLNYLYFTGSFMNKFYDQVLSDQNKRIGDVILRMQEELKYGDQEDDLTRRFTLLGDPALKIPIDILMSVDLPGRKTENKNEETAAFFSYPNPLTTYTKITFTLNAESRVQVDIYNSEGIIITRLTDSVFPAGKHSLTWSPGNIPSGSYIAKIKTGNKVYNINLAVVR